MALWLSAGISIACLLIGYGVACFTEGTARDELEHDNFRMEIEIERLKEGRP
jgi:hypothetical protein